MTDPKTPDPAAVLFKTRAMTAVDALGADLADAEQFTDADLVRLVAASKGLAKTCTELSKAALEQLAARHPVGWALTEPGAGSVRLKPASVTVHRYMDALYVLARRHWETDGELPEVVRLFLNDVEAVMPANVTMRVGGLDRLGIPRDSVIITDTAPDTPVPDWKD